MLSLFPQLLLRFTIMYKTNDIIIHYVPSLMIRCCTSIIAIYDNNTIWHMVAEMEAGAAREE